jgi:hypothetical protein
MKMRLDEADLPNDPIPHMLERLLSTIETMPPVETATLGEIMLWQASAKHQAMSIREEMKI